MAAQNPPDRLDSVLIRTKITRPATRAGLVKRRGLLKNLDDAVSAETVKKPALALETVAQSTLPFSSWS